MAIKPSKLQTDTPRTDSFSLSAAISRHEDDAEHWKKYASRMLDWARGLERECASLEANLRSPEDRAIALLRELNDALAVPGYLQARVDEILDSCEPQLGDSK